MAGQSDNPDTKGPPSDLRPTLDEGMYLGLYTGPRVAPGTAAGQPRRVTRPPQDTSDC
jgi:hypothetical protein